MRTLLLIVLAQAVYACADCHDGTVLYCDAPRVDVKLPNIETNDADTMKDIEDWARDTAGCFGEALDASTIDVTFVPDDATVTKLCGTQAAGCYLYGEGTSEIVLSLASRWAWPEEFAHELGHAHYAAMTGDGDFNHDHGVWFGRPPDEYNWDDTTGSVANCVDLSNL